MQTATADPRARAGHGFAAMVLAGGLGTRLRAVVADRPKPMAEVDGEPFLARLLDQLAAAGCEHAILCTGHLGEQIANAFAGDHGGMRVTCSQEPAPLGTGGALRLALAQTRASSVLVCNGDSYVGTELAAFVRWAKAGGMPALLAVRVADARRYGTLQLAAHGRVNGFAAQGQVGAACINAGIYWLPRAALARPALGSCCSLERDVLPSLVADGLFAHEVDAPFLDIGVPADYARASAFFAEVAQRTARPRRGLLVVDRDGTLIEEKHYLADPAGVALLPGVVDGLRAFQQRGFDVAVVTNQSGIGRGLFGPDALAAVHGELERQLGAHGIALAGIWHCPHHPELGCACRKPEPQLLEDAMQRLGYRPEQCLVVGDKRCDIELGARVGARTALVRTGYGLGTERDGSCAPDHVVDSLADLAHKELA